MPADHYDTLGVPRDADAAAIKRAHRAAARRHHPDTPDGDREQFEAAQRAYLVLSDPDLRAKYDRGEDPTAGPDNRQAIVMQLAIKAFMEAAAGGETRHDDFIAAARRALEHDSDMATQALDKLRSERSKWQEVADRVSRDEAAGPNFLAQSINAQIAGIDEDTRRISERLGQLRDAIEALEGFAYEKRIHKLIIEMQSPPLARIGVTAQFDYGNGEKPIAGKRDFTVQGAGDGIDFLVAGGGGDWDIALWNEFYWSSPVESTAEADIDGDGMNVSFIIAADSDELEPAHVLQAYTVMHSRRRLVR